MRHTGIIEKIFASITFIRYNAAEYAGTRIEVDKDFVAKKLASIEIDRAPKGLL